MSQRGMIEDIQKATVYIKLFGCSAKLCKDTCCIGCDIFQNCLDEWKKGNLVLCKIDKKKTHCQIICRILGIPSPRPRL